MNRDFAAEELAELEAKLQKEKTWLRKMVNDDTQFNMCTTFGKNVVTTGLRISELQSQIDTLRLVMLMETN